MCMSTKLCPFIDPVAKNFETVSEIDLDFIDVLRIPDIHGAKFQ